MARAGDGARIDGSGIDKVLQEAVASGAVPHAAAIAADRDGVIYQGAVGPRAVGENDAVSTDTLFRILSMTKMPVTVVALQEMEKGNLDLDAPVAERLHHVRAGAAARRRTGRHPHHEAGDRGRRVPQPDRRPGLPRRDPDLRPAARNTLAMGPGYKWGYGLVLKTQDIPGMRRAWSGAWAGLCNTHFWVDRSTGICASIYGNFLPFVTPEAFALYQDFERALYAAC